MADSTTYYLAGVGTGQVLTHKDPSRLVFENKGEHDDEEKWTVEHGDEPNVVALRNVASGKYINCPNAKNSEIIGTGEKQWWVMSNDNVTPHGAFRFNLVDSPGLFLYTSGGVMSKGKTLGVSLHTWRVCIQRNHTHLLALMRQP
jgi:hypothetical protein